MQRYYSPEFVGVRAELTGPPVYLPPPERRVSESVIAGRRKRLCILTPDRAVVWRSLMYCTY